jgi:PAS domain S-box-containing protein
MMLQRPIGVATSILRGPRRYLLALGVALFAFGLTALLAPVTGSGAPFLIFLLAVMVTAVYAGIGPGVLTLLIGLALSLPVLIEHARYTLPQTGLEALLYLGNGFLVVFLVALSNRAQRSLRARNQPLRSGDERERLAVNAQQVQVAELVPEIVWVADRAGAVTYINQQWASYTGHPLEQGHGDRWMSPLHPDDRARVSEAWRYAVQTGGTYAIECRQRRADGTYRWWLVRGLPLHDRSGQLTGWCGVCTDIDDLKRTEEALRQSEAKLSGIISISADAIISIDEQQRIIVFNEGAENLFGHRRDEVIGQSLDMLIPERFRAIHREHVARFAAGHQFTRHLGELREVTGLRRDGTEFPAEAAISKVTVGDSTTLSVAMRDLTEHKRVEESLRRAVSARDQLLGIVAHDLRNPLSSILLQASSLKRRGADPDRRNPRPLEVISRAAKRMNRLIQDLLDASLVEAGQLKLERAPVSAESAVVEAVDAETPLASSAGVEVRYEVTADPHEVWADHDRLQQVFDNLIGNAIKFTQAGGRVTVGAVSRDEHVLFWVADTGRGIASESQLHIFDRFWQESAGASRLGAGLGLQISRGIVEAHGGHIWVESELGRGTTFYFTIPTTRSTAGERSAGALH